MKAYFFLILYLCLGFSLVSNAIETTPILLQKKTPQVRISKKIKSFVIGAEARSYTYTEPNFLAHKGYMFGVWGEWYWSSFVGNGKTQANFIYGVLDYDGALCDLSNNCTPYKSTTNDYIIKLNSKLEFNVTNNIKLFAGLGYRYLYDLGNSSAFYSRTGTWGYVPLGIVVQIPMNNNKFLFDIEYDYIFYGKFKSNLSEASKTLNDITHAQNTGYGLLASVGYDWNQEYNFYVYYESWNLAKSDVVDNFIEPENNYQSLGFKMGYLF